MIRYRHNKTHKIYEVASIVDDFVILDDQSVLTQTQLLDNYTVDKTGYDYTNLPYDDVNDIGISISIEEGLPTSERNERIEQMNKRSSETYDSDIPCYTADGIEIPASVKAKLSMIRRRQQQIDNIKLDD